MIIIFEGPDGAGKSTLLKEVASWGEANNMKVTGSHHGIYAGMANPAVKYLTSLRRRDHVGQKELVLLDRSWLSEVIYGPIVRGHDRLGVAGRRMLERVALKCGAVIIKCLPPYTVAVNNWLRRKGDEYIQKEPVFRLVYDAYNDLRTDLPTITYDYTIGPPKFEEVVVELLGYRPPNNGIGRWDSTSKVLIGDQVSKHGLPDLPFVSFHRGGCSAWLAEQLEEWGIGEDKLYWVNSDRLSPDFVGRPDAPKHFIALGAAAARWCQQVGLDFKHVAHPQYQKRFHYDDGYDQLKRAIV